MSQHQYNDAKRKGFIEGFQDAINQILYYEDERCNICDCEYCNGYTNDNPCESHKAEQEIIKSLNKRLKQLKGNSND